MMGSDKPAHPMISIIDFSKMEEQDLPEQAKIVSSLYSIMMKAGNCGILRYGRKEYDFQEGALLCMGPDQVMTVESTEEERTTSGLGLFFHPDLIRKNPLMKRMKEFTFFSYATNEALHLSEKERQNLADIFKRIEDEYTGNLDHYSHDVIISSLELLLNYCQRYYGRQFITRTNHNKDVLTELENLLSTYFNSEKALMQGIPSVKFCAEQLHFSPNYLSDLVKKESGKSVQEHIHYHLIEKAKTELLTSEKSVSEIASELGFEYPQYFSKIFKLKTGFSPVEYRRVN
jgi:AraC-like DNA-binding protein